MSTKILYFITGDYAQIPKEFISENRLFLSCLVFEVKHFFLVFEVKHFFFEWYLWYHSDIFTKVKKYLFKAMNIIINKTHGITEGRWRGSGRWRWTSGGGV